MNHSPIVENILGTGKEFAMVGVDFLETEAKDAVIFFCLLRSGIGAWHMMIQLFGDFPAPNPGLIHQLPKDPPGHLI